MRSHSYLKTARQVIQQYDGGQPLAGWLRIFFKSEKKFGSTDRRQISHACYCYYRLGNAFQHLDFEERMLVALFLCSPSSNLVLKELKPEWNEKTAWALSEKIKAVGGDAEIEKIFPFAFELSGEIDQQAFYLSLLLQPDLFLRARPGKREQVVEKLKAASIPFESCQEDCIRLPNQSKIEDVIRLDEEAVIQDLNSQDVLQSFRGILSTTATEPQAKRIDISRPSLWDCCAASGGKSILFHDLFPRSIITVSDVRESILHNLQNRFKRAGIGNYHRFVADLSKGSVSASKKFEVVLCDAPCSGSGTWARTPEQLWFFPGEKIKHYAELQKKIALHASVSMKKGGYFLYITCSLFTKENEEVVHWLKQNASFQLLSMQYFKGYDKKADTLFVAVFSTL